MNRERDNDERFAGCVLILALLLIAVGIVFRPQVYPAIAALLRGLGAS